MKLKIALLTVVMGITFAVYQRSEASDNGSGLEFKIEVQEECFPSSMRDILVAAAPSELYFEVRVEGQPYTLHGGRVELYKQEIPFLNQNGTAKNVIEASGVVSFYLKYGTLSDLVLSVELVDRDLFFNDRTSIINHPLFKNRDIETRSNCFELVTRVLR